MAAANNAKMSGARKAAVVLIAMGEEASAEVFKHLNEREIEALIREMTALGDISVPETEKVVEEFHSTAVAAESVLRGDEDVARRVLTKTLGTEAARTMVDRVQRSVVPKTGFAALQKAHPEQLSKIIAGEHPQTIALVLLHMKPESAAQVVATLPDDLRVDVLSRMSNIDEISPETINRIAAVIDQRLKALAGPSREQTGGGTRAVASLFKHLEATLKEPTLEAIGAHKPELAQSIRDLMFVFEDILRIDEAGMREIVQQVDKKILTTALKGASGEIRKKFFDYMSKRAGEMMREDMDAMGAVRLRDVEKAQQEVVALVRRLEEEGTISTGSSGGGGASGADEYVR